MADLSQYADIDIINIVSSDAEAELKKRGYDYGWYKIEPYVGSIYILVNPAFPNLVKIGYADDAQKRMRTLNSNSGLPDPYHCYAIYKVKKRLEDLKLHGLIDSLDSSLRHAKNREFYEMDAQKAYSVLSAIAQISGDEEQLIINPFNDDYFDKPKVGNQSVLSGIRLVADSRDSKGNQVNDIKQKQHKKSFFGQLPDGTYYFKRRKVADNKLVVATAVVNNGIWTILKDSVLGIFEDTGVPENARVVRANLPIDSNGKLLKDFEIGNCSPSFAGAIVMNQSCSGWSEWKNGKGEPIGVYRNEK